MGLKDNPDSARLVVGSGLGILPERSFFAGSATTAVKTNHGDPSQAARPRVCALGVHTAAVGHVQQAEVRAARFVVAAGAGIHQDRLNANREVVENVGSQLHRRRRRNVDSLLAREQR